jgi:peptidoglycan/LPS O-acetylase OafA/YrhL
MAFFSLRRVTSGGKFIPEIDGLRFVAIASVVISHVQSLLVERSSIASNGGWLFRAVDHGWRGVDLFFVISGFILALPFAVHRLEAGLRVSLKNYFRRRLTRLEPPYFVCMTFMFLVFSAFRHNGQTTQFWARHFAASLIYCHNVIYGTGSLLNGVAWSLEVEIQFYCLVPLLTLVFAIQNKNVRRLLIVAAILAAGINQQVWLSNPRLYISIAGQIQYFLAGFLLADIYLIEWHRKSRQSWAWDLIAIVGLSIAFYANGAAFYVVFPFLLLALCCAAFRGVLLNRILAWPIITITGGMCYSIYLLHFILIANALGITSAIIKNRSYYVFLPLQVAMMALLVGVISITYFIAIERPCMRSDWPQRLWNLLLVKRHFEPQISKTLGEIGQPADRE